jgi:hypothetical protein
MFSTLCWKSLSSGVTSTRTVGPLKTHSNDHHLQPFRTIARSERPVTWFPVGVRIPHLHR